MATAPPFPEPWGWSQLMGENTTNIVNASLQAWNSAAKDINQTTGAALVTHPGMASVFLFGSLPLIFATMVYIRTQKLIPSTFVMLLTTVAIHVFHLTNTRFSSISWKLSVLALGLSIAYSLWNKEVS